jgi:F-type H+-transporting ATPase subunit a
VGTPYVLIPFIVLIELVSNVIRPITLSVRLAANLVAGHLLMTLVSSPIVNSNIISIIILLSCLYLLIILESAVAFIQAYVFSILRTLYLAEVNYLKFNYLYN